MAWIDLEGDSWSGGAVRSRVRKGNSYPSSVLLAREKQDDQDRQTVDEELLEKLKVLGYVR